MITCKNCGAEFDEKALKCPYCGYENVAVAQDDYHKKVDAYVREREEINKLPKKVVNKAAVVFAVIIAVFVIAGIAVPVVNARREAREQEAFMENRFEILDDYLENGQYQEFYDLYKEVKDPFDSYGYEEIYYAYEEFSKIKEEVEETAIWDDKQEYEHKIYIVYDILYRMRRLSDYVARTTCDKTLYGNEMYLEDIFSKSKDYVLKVSLIDLQSVETVLNYSNKDISDFCMDYAKSIIESLE